MIVVPSDAPAVPGCVRCGRGEYDDSVSPVKFPADRIEALKKMTHLVKVKCPLQMNHLDAFDEHAQRCGGTVWAHEFQRICDAVQKNAKRT